jgi:hypothetical protein
LAASKLFYEAESRAKQDQLEVVLEVAEVDKNGGKSEKKIKNQKIYHEENKNTEKRFPKYKKLYLKIKNITDKISDFYTLVYLGKWNA